VHYFLSPFVRTGNPHKLYYMCTTFCALVMHKKLAALIISKAQVRSNSSKWLRLGHRLQGGI